MTPSLKVTQSYVIQKEQKVVALNEQNLLEMGAERSRHFTSRGRMKEISNIYQNKVYSHLTLTVCRLPTTKKCKLFKLHQLHEKLIDNTVKSLQIHHWEMVQSITVAMNASVNSDSRHETRGDRYLYEYNQRLFEISFIDHKSRCGCPTLFHIVVGLAVLLRMIRLQNNNERQRSV